MPLGSLASQELFPFPKSHEAFVGMGYLVSNESGPSLTGGTGSVFHLPSDFGFLHYRNIVFAVRLPGDGQEAPKLFWR